MARGINKVILVGNLGNDPETSYTQGGMAITKVSLATTTVRKDRDGMQQEKTEWHRVTFFGKLAEIAAEYLRKGRQVYVEGRLSYGSYEKDGVRHYTTDIIADDMQMLGGGARGDDGGYGGGGGYEQRGPRQQPAQRREPQQQGGYGDDGYGGGYGNNYGNNQGGNRAPQRQSSPPPAADFGGSDGFDDDDIPF
ncbi:single-stranded DNA-binding protein [Lysobacteraceae bacterium NML120232]|nr:single-stranded DNA-binding protein [Xanthomonadaceae bacterium NML08-0793]PJK12661.1 single-stranded DNA-binding protein [Xanthomonadaceae bacterium NML120232]